MTTSLRDRISVPFRGNRIFVVGELMIVCGLLALELKDAPGLLLVFPLGWISLGLRKLGWHGVGLQRPASWPRTLGLGVLIGIITQLISMWLIDPWLVRLTGQPFNAEQFARLPGSLPNLVAWILIGWLLGALLEEMVFRGYLLNRFTDLLGDNRLGLTIGVIVASLLFAIGHTNLGITSVLETFIFALIYAGLYLAAHRNLWLPIIAHGVYNTFMFVLLYLGYNPAWMSF